jgi:hypothetical protein
MYSCSKQLHATLAVMQGSASYLGAMLRSDAASFFIRLVNFASKLTPCGL